MSERLLHTDWVVCPVCGGDDMRRETYVDGVPEGQPVTPDDVQYHYIFCVNTSCGSNGGDNYSNVMCDENDCECECQDQEDHVCPEPVNKTWPDVIDNLVDNVFSLNFALFLVIFVGPGIYQLVKAILHAN